MRHCAVYESRRGRWQAGQNPRQVRTPEAERSPADLSRRQAQHALEKVRQMLGPLRLPHTLLMKVEGCNGVSNAWYDEGAVTVCYEYLDELWKNMPEQPTAAGMAPADALIGPSVSL
jgi:Putative metallopeptidase